MQYKVVVHQSRPLFIFRFNLDTEALKLAIDNKKEDIAKFLVETCGVRKDVEFKVSTHFKIEITLLFAVKNS